MRKKFFSIDTIINNIPENLRRDVEIEWHNHGSDERKKIIYRLHDETLGRKSGYGGGIKIKFGRQANNELEIIDNLVKQGCLIEAVDISGSDNQDSILRYLLNKKCPIRSLCFEYGGIENDLMHKLVQENGASLIELKIREVVDGCDVGINGNQSQLVEFIGHFPNLKSLAISPGDHRGGDTVFDHRVFQSLPNLEKVDLADYHYISPRTIDSLADNCLALREVVFSNYDNIQNVLDQPLCNLFTKCDNIRDVTLEDFTISSSDLTSNSVTVLALNNKRLSNLRLYRCVFDSEQDLINVLTSLSRCSGLKTLDLLDCVSQDHGENSDDVDKAMKLLVRKCPYITRLTLPDGTELSDEALDDFLREESPTTSPRPTSDSTASPRSPHSDYR